MRFLPARHVFACEDGALDAQYPVPGTASNHAMAP